MDMSGGFAAATVRQAPQVAIVHDKCHVAKMLNEAVDSVRRKEHKQLLSNELNWVTPYDRLLPLGERPTQFR
jgi:transposase